MSPQSGNPILKIIHRHSDISPTITPNLDPTQNWILVFNHAYNEAVKSRIKINNLQGTKIVKGTKFTCSV